ncbi:c2h2 transcription factor [Phaffia rhodozyma]|uniref:C2h2 transcription factor n=1 Tax=Phaffia rhodozyma TaxID=264483 RepID=A0A0F7SX37_PHARH|nr:c2h2 transcription factor [Phaffia rhodozyma]
MQPIPTPVPIASSYHSAINRTDYHHVEAINSFPRQQSWSKELSGGSQQQQPSAGWSGSMGMGCIGMGMGMGSSPSDGGSGLGIPLDITPNRQVASGGIGIGSPDELDGLYSSGHTTEGTGLWAPSGSWRGEGWRGLTVPPSSPNIPLSSSLTFLSPLQSGSYLPSSPALSRMGDLSMSVDSTQSSLPHRSQSDVGSLAAHRCSFSTAGHEAYVTSSLGGNRLMGAGSGSGGNAYYGNSGSHQASSTGGPFGSGYGSGQFAGPSSVERLSKLEQNFTSNFTCCGLQLKGLHDLLEHYEESHVLIGNGNINGGNSTPAGLLPFQKPSMISRTSSGSGANVISHLSSSTPPLMQSFSAPGHPTTPSPTTDSDSPHTPGLMDLEMEDTITLPSPFSRPPRSATVNIPTGISSFPSPWSSASALSSHPATPVPQCVPPSLLTYALPSRSNSTPATSAVTSPASSLGSLGSLPGSLSSSGLLVGGGNNTGGGVNRTEKRRTASTSAVKDRSDETESTNVHLGGFNSNNVNSNSNNFNSPNTPGESLGLGLTGSGRSTPVISETSVVMDLSAAAGGGEKRFRCPVEGCGKVYKQQNGLKYHLQRSINSNHGHYKGSITSVGAVVLTPASESFTPVSASASNSSISAPAQMSAGGVGGPGAGSSPASPFGGSGASWVGRMNGLST